MPRLYSPNLPGTPILGRTITVPVPFTRPGRTTRISPRFIFLIVGICTILGLVLHPASPAKGIPAKLSLGRVEDLDLVTEAHGSGWGWYGQTGVRETVLVTGGAGQLGQALIPSLMKNYNVHVLDTAPRPASLPISPSLTYHRGSIDPSSPALAKLFAKTRIDGIIHLGGVSLEEWCVSRLEACENVNVGGTKALMNQVRKGGKGKRQSPWVVLASSMDVLGTGEGHGERYPTTAIGKTKLAAELIIEEATESDADLRTAIVRMDEIYGYPNAGSIASTFIPSLITNALTGLPIQYSSTRAGRDYVHIDDALTRWVTIIEKVRRAEVGEGVGYHDLISGIRTTEVEIVDIVRRQTDTLSPIRDIGTGSGASSHIATQSTGDDWKPMIDLEAGLARTITDLISANEKYNLAYLSQHCPSSPSSTFPTAHKIHPADERNKDLTKLNGCTVNIGFDHAGYLHHLKCEDGKHCIVDGEKVPSYNWNQSVFIVHKVPARKEERRIRVRLEEEKGMGWLGFSRTGSAGPEIGLELYGKNELGVETSFDLEVQSDASNLRLLLPGSGEQIHAISNTTSETNWFTLHPTPGVFDMRMTVLCCPSEGDWPLLLDDHESADIRFGTTGQIPFNSSRRLHLCDRATEAVKYESARNIKHHQLTAPIIPTTGKAKQHPVSSRPNSWALRDLPPCWNDCDAPTICVQTGSCRCVQADNCPPRRENPLLTSTRSNSISTNAKLGSHLGSLAAYSPVLIEAVSKTDWRDILLPHAREALTANPDFIKLHVADGYTGQASIESADCHNLQSKHCFSADSILYKAMRHISVPADQADLIVLPVYQHCTGADFMLHDVMAFARETIPGVKTGEKPVSVVMTHDWGICIAFAWEIWSARHKHSLYPDSILDNTLVFSVMGDYDSPCYRPAQDVVIPARTCQSISLKDHFSSVEKVKPARERPNLMTWSGTYWGTGKSERLRLTCERGGAGKKELIPGGGPRSNFETWDYMNDLSNARFCPQPRGIAGWSPRVSDAIYAGCIPILTAEGSHYPFASVLDWSKFSVRIAPTELDNIEAILAAIPLEKVEEMQANLVAVREAFIYATDEKPEEELERRGPMFFALHEAGLRLKTKYPTKV